MAMPPVQILILAAGASARMGGVDKLILPVDGVPLLARVAAAALATGAPVTVVLPPDRPAREAALAGLPLARATAREAAGGMAESLKAGLAALPAGAPVMVVLADMPDLETADLRRMIDLAQQMPAAILRGAAADGRPGHPVLFPPDLRPELMALSGDAGARAVLERHRDRIHILALPGTRALTDLDTPADWDAWRARPPDSG